MQNIEPILRTETLKDLLMELFFHTDSPRTLTDLAEAIDVDQTTVMREVNRLLETGVVVEERVGRSRTIEIDPSSPMAGPLRTLIALAREPEDVAIEDSHGPTKRSHRPTNRRPLPSSRSRSR